MRLVLDLTGRLIILLGIKTRQIWYISKVDVAIEKGATMRLEYGNQQDSRKASMH